MMAWGSRAIAAENQRMLSEVLARLTDLEHQADLMKTVLTVREPTSVIAADAFDGLRKQVIAAVGERMSHLSQLVDMAVALDRSPSADELDGLRAKVGEWMAQAGIETLWSVPAGSRVSDVFERLDQSPIEDDEIDVLEPAYVDTKTGRVLRRGRVNPDVSEAKQPKTEDET